MISIVIPLYNKEKHIAKTLQTVFNQTFQDFEIVIVDDGSTDNSIHEVGKFNDPRIRLIPQPNAGVSVARNRGIENAQYDLIAFLDADDEWKPEYLQTQYELSQKYPECSVFACSYEFKNENGKTTPTIIKKLPFNEIDGILDNYFEVASCSHPPLWTSAVMVKKEAILSVNGFPFGIKSGEDLLTWARLAIKYKIAYNRQVLAVFVLDPSHKISAIPSRAHDENDKVGANLIRLFQEENTKLTKKQLKNYVSLWYKMRASVYLRLYDVKNTIQYSIKSLKYNTTNWKVYMFILIVLLPKRIQQTIKKYHQ